MSLAKLEKVFRDMLSPDDDTPVASLRYGRSQGWDSLAHMQLVDELEVAFGVTLDSDDVADIDSFDAAQAVLARHEVTFSS